MKLLTAEQMQYVDRMTIKGGTPGIDLMRNAGLAVFDRIGTMPEADPDALHVVVCGKGNNGGDGFRVAELLARDGRDTVIYLLGSTSSIRGDAATCMKDAVKAGLSIVEITDSDGLMSLREDLESAVVIVDAIFGTGLKGEVQGMAGAVIEAMNRSAAVIVSVDIPSGVDAGTGEMSAISIWADYTVTFGTLKAGHVLMPGRGACGDVTVADIGFSPRVMASVNSIGNTLTPAEAARLIPSRAYDSHKGDAGRLLVIAGSVGLTGAAALASSSAMRIGAGLVTVGCPSSLNDILEIKLTEVMTLPLAEVRKKRCLSLRALGMIREVAKNMDAVAIGPGLGRYFETRDLVKRFLSGYEGKIVLDADGIHAFAGEPELLRECPGSIVITPHPGELSALTGMSIDDIMEDRMGAVIKAAESTGCIVLLKGAPSVIADPSGDIWINGSGNEGMATAGMGDVLTGTIAGLAAQGLDIKSSAILGAFLHGIAGEIISYERGILGVMAGDVADALSDAIMDILATGR